VLSSIGAMSSHPAALPHPRRAFLPSERELLGAASLADALDAGLTDRADTTSDPYAVLRVARMEQMAGRGASALRHARRAASLEPTLTATLSQMRRIESIWATTAEWAGESPGVDGDDATRLLVAVVDLHVLLALDAPQTRLTWEDVQERADAVAQLAESWLAASTSPLALADGIATALHAALAATMAERPAWAITFLTAVRQRAQRVRLAVWTPILDLVEALPAILLGRYVEGERLLTRAIGVLRRDPGQPWHAMAVAARVGVAAMTRTVAPQDLTPFERELTEGRWTQTAPYARQTASTIIGRVAVALGDPERGSRLIELTGPLDELRIAHTERVLTREWAFAGRMLRGETADATRLRDGTARLYVSRTRKASVARMDVRLGNSTEHPAGGETPMDVLRGDHAVLAAAMASGDRAAALAALATIDEHGSSMPVPPAGGSAGAQSAPARGGRARGRRDDQSSDRGGAVPQSPHRGDPRPSGAQRSRHHAAGTARRGADPREDPPGLDPRGAQPAPWTGRGAHQRRLHQRRDRRGSRDR
jgi:hypothetical protein